MANPRIRRLYQTPEIDEYWYDVWEIDPGDGLHTCLMSCSRWGEVSVFGAEDFEIIHVGPHEVDVKALIGALIHLELKRPTWHEIDSILLDALREEGFHLRGCD